MSPILVRTIITFAEKRFAAHNGSGKAQPLVEGVFMAIGLFLLSNIQNFGQQHVRLPRLSPFNSLLTSVDCTRQFFWRAMSAGVLARGALIASVYSRGVRLTPATRSEGGYDNSKLLHYVSGDISRIDAASQWFVSHRSTFILLFLLPIRSSRSWLMFDLHYSMRLGRHRYKSQFVLSSSSLSSVQRH